MTTFSLDTDLINELIEVWIKNNPIDTDLATTKIIRRVFLNYIKNNKSDKNDKKTD